MDAYTKRWLAGETRCGKAIRMAERERTRMLRTNRETRKAERAPIRAANRERNNILAAERAKRRNRREAKRPADAPITPAPYERAVRRVERLTGRPRVEWEFVPGHLLATLAREASRLLAESCA